MEIRKLEKSEFPRALLEIPEPPENLWLTGGKPDEREVFLCVVGSRKNTSYGREACQKIVAGLKGYPISIVSGFAMGIDTVAHRVAMEARLRTIVFPGSGLSEEAIYPKANARMMDEIAGSGGCLISEFEPDFKATMWSFPRRNRLMAGISKATLVVEAAEKSGTLITARLAVEYDRDLLAVPGSIFLPSSAGTNRLIRQGAVPVTSSEDVLEALGFERPRDEEKQKELFEDLSDREKKVAEILNEPVPRDVMIRKLGVGAAEANEILSVMEIKGLIREEFGELRLTI